MPDEAPVSPLRPVQAEALAHIVRRMSRAAEPPWLHGEVARRMAERLALIRLQPRSAIDWCSFNGASQHLLPAAYPKARLQRVEVDARLRERPGAARRPWWSTRRAQVDGSASLAPQQVPPGAAELLWSNMMLHLTAQPLASLQQWHSALAAGGFLMFSTLGPGSLHGLRRTYAQAGWPAPHAPFVDMHDLGDMLVRCGFADPVMDQEIITLTWSDAGALLRELRSLGGNADSHRSAGLRTPRWRDQLCAQLQHLAGADGRLRLEFEVVYGHAFKGLPRLPVAAQTSVALDTMRTLVREGRRKRGGGHGLG